MNLTDIPLGDVIYWRMVFGAVVSEVVGAWCPVVSKFALRVSALYPVELCVHGLCFVGGGCFIDHSNVSRVFALDW